MAYTGYNEKYYRATGQKVPTAQLTAEQLKSVGQSQYIKKNTPTSTVSMFSSDSGLTKLNSDTKKLDTYSPKTSPTYVPPPNQYTAPEKTAKPEAKAYFTNDAGQELELTESQLKQSKYRDIINSGGYVQTRTEGPNYDAGKGLNDAVEQVDSQIEDLITEFNNYNVDTDPAFQSQQDSIRAQYAQLRTETQKTNYQRAQAYKTMGYRTGGAQYTGETQLGIEGEELTQANARIAEINRQEADAIAGARKAQQEGKYSLFSQHVNALDKIRENKAEALKTYNEKLAGLLKSTKEANAKVQEDIDSIIKDAAKNGAPSETINSINTAKSVADAVKLAGDYLQAGSGIVGEYQFYKRDAASRGFEPVDFNTYQTMDANRKARATAVANAGGLTTQENSTYLTITNKYQADAVINASIKAEQIRTLANQIIADPNKATNQLASLYIFVKNLDPESAVREGELSLANATQSYLGKFGNSLARLAQGRVVSPTAAKELATATKELVGTWEQTAKRKTQFYKSQANNSSPNVGSAFNKYLSDVESQKSVSDELIKQAEEAKTTVISKAKSNPELANKVRGWLSVNDTTLGRPLTYEEILQVYPEYFN